MTRDLQAGVKQELKYLTVLIHYNIYNYKQLNHKILQDFLYIMMISAKT